MDKQQLETTLFEWVNEKEKNGIKQHSRKWLTAKASTIGGSSMATIQGKNPYSSLIKLISEKIGLSKFESSIAPQWGNLFEDVIKRYVEHDKQCLVLGEDLYIDGPPNTAYSPDGLAVMDFVVYNMVEEETVEQTANGPRKVLHLVDEEVRKTAIVLCEFKCPYSRIPTGIPPVYYVPQVKMGLDILELPTVGLLVEAVFRRCTWAQIGNNPIYDKTLVSRSSGKLPLAYGINGFYYDDASYKRQLAKVDGPAALKKLEDQKEKLWDDYDQFFVEKGDDTNGFMCSDMGEAPPELFKTIMDAYDKRILTPWHGPITFIDRNKQTEQINDLPQYNEIDEVQSMHDSMCAYMEFCARSKFINFGILPWKLFRIDYNFINKDDNYLSQWLPTINEVMTVVNECNAPENAAIKLNLYTSYVNKTNGGGFSDDV